MSWILAEGSSLQVEGLRQPLQILRPLGGGTQGQVYAVRLGEEELALKWYLPACIARDRDCLLYTSPSPRDRQKSRMPSSA